MTRTDAIIRRITALLERRRREIDGANDLTGLELDLRFSPGCLEPRSVMDRIQREQREQRRGEEQ